MVSAAGLEPAMTGIKIRRLRAFSSEVGTGSRQENASNQKSRAPFRFHRNGALTSLATRPRILSCIWSCQREFNPRSPALKAPYPWHQAMAGWCGRPGSNRTPPVWKTGTQPTTPRPQEWNSRNGRGRCRGGIQPAPSVLLGPIDRDGIADRVRGMAESTGIEPVRPEGLDALAPRCLTARPTLQFK